MDCSPPGSSVHGISRQAFWCGLLIPSAGDLPNLGIQPIFPVLADRLFNTEPPGNSQWDITHPLKRNNEMMLSVATWMDLEIIIPSEGSQRKTNVL